MEKVLNQEEIDDMVRAARSGTATAGSIGPVVHVWDVRQAGQIGREQLRAINQLHELFARNLTTSIGGYLRISFDCSLVSAEHLTYREFLQRVPEKTYLASIELAPVGAVAVLQLDLAIIFPIIDVDSHLSEPPDLWTKRLSPKWADVAPRVVLTPAPPPPEL